MSESAARGINWAALQPLCEAKGWTTDQQIADGIGISYQMLRHLKTGYAQPGPKTVDGVLRVFGTDVYTDVFGEPRRARVAP